MIVLTFMLVKVTNIFLYSKVIFFKKCCNRNNTTQ